MFTFLLNAFNGHAILKQCLNLLPGLGLDGGPVVRACLHILVNP